MPNSAPRKREICGVGISITDYAQTLDYIDDAVAAGLKTYICVAPTHSIVTVANNRELHDVFERAAIVTPDGMPVVWAARLLGEKLSDRVYGPDLMLMHCARAARSGARVWLFGGHDETSLTALRRNLCDRFAGLNIVGGWPPPYRDLTDAERSDLVARINDDAPDIVWVGLGMPKQELWMAQIRQELNAPVLIGVGAAFDFHAGRVRQAPRFMQRVGLEWLYRLAQDPRRLAGRYLRSNPRFVWLLLRQLLRERRSRASA